MTIAVGSGYHGVMEADDGQEIEGRSNIVVKGGEVDNCRIVD